LIATEAVRGKLLNISVGDVAGIKIRCDSYLFKNLDGKALIVGNIKGETSVRG
jgi:hypothetical protein